MKHVPVINVSETGKVLKALRIKNGLTVRNIQDELNFTNPVCIYKWERGGSIPSIDNLVILAKLYGVRIDDILAVE